VARLEVGVPVGPSQYGSFCHQGFLLVVGSPAAVTVRGAFRLGTRKRGSSAQHSVGRRSSLTCEPLLASPEIEEEAATDPLGGHSTLAPVAHASDRYTEVFGGALDLSEARPKSLGHALCDGVENVLGEFEGDGHESITRATVRP